MPVPAPRDPGATRDTRTGWLGDPVRLPGANLQTPEFANVPGADPVLQSLP